MVSDKKKEKKKSTEMLIIIDGLFKPMFIQITAWYLRN